MKACSEFLIIKSSAGNPKSIAIVRREGDEEEHGGQRRRFLIVSVHHHHQTINAPWAFLSAPPTSSMPLGSAWMASPIPCMCMLKLNVDASWYRGPYYFHILNGKYNAVRFGDQLSIDCSFCCSYSILVLNLLAPLETCFSFFSCNFKSASFQFIKRTYDCFVLFGLLYRRFSSSTRFVVRHLIIFLLGLKKEKKKNQNLIY